MLQLFAQRIVLTQTIAIIFAAFAAFHVVLPVAITQASVVAVALLVVALATTIMRYRTPGDVGADAKAWYQSKILWTQAVAVGFALLTLAGVPPVFIDQSDAVELVMAIVGLVTIRLHTAGVTQPIA